MEKNLLVTKTRHEQCQPQPKFVFCHAKDAKNSNVPSKDGLNEAIDDPIPHVAVSNSQQYHQSMSENRKISEIGKNRPVTESNHHFLTPNKFYMFKYNKCLTMMLLRYVQICKKMLKLMFIYYYNF